MATNCNVEQDARDGTGQSRRFLQALDATRIMLDDRKPQDLLVFAKHYADLIRFYDVDTPVDWITTPESEINIKNAHGDVANSPTVKESETNKKYPTWKEFFYQDIAVVVASIAQYKSQLGRLKEEYDDLRKQIAQQPDLE